MKKNYRTTASVRNILVIMLLILTSCLPAVAQHEVWSSWQTVYTLGNGRVDISFKIYGCAASPNSYFRINSTIQTEYWDFLDFKFEYIDCNDKVSYEKVHMNLSQDRGFINKPDMWFLAKRVTRVLDVKYTPAFQRKNASKTSQSHSSESSTPEQQHQQLEEQKKQDEQNLVQQEQAEAERLRQQQILAQRNEAEKQRQQEAERLQQQTNQYLQQAQDDNNSEITQTMYLNQAKLKMTEQQLKGASPEDLAAQQQQVNQIQAQQTQQNIENLTNTAVNIFGLWSNVREERRNREAEDRRRKAQAEAMKTPEQRQREKEEAGRRRIEKERKDAEEARIRAVEREKFLKEVKFNMQLQYGLGMDNIPIIVNDEISKQTESYKTFHPIINIGVQSNILDHQGISFHITPCLSYGRNLFEKRKGSHLAYGLDAMIYFGKARESTLRFFLEGALLKRKGDYQSQSGSIFGGTTNTPASLRKGGYTYGVIRYGGGVMLHVWGLYTVFKPGVFLEKLSFFDANNKAVMVGNLQALIHNKVIIDLSYSRNYPISGEITYPETLEKSNQDYYSIKIFLRTTLIK